MERFLSCCGQICKCIGELHDILENESYIISALRYCKSLDCLTVIFFSSNCIKDIKSIAFKRWQESIKTQLILLTTKQRIKKAFEWLLIAIIYALLRCSATIERIILHSVKFIKMICKKSVLWFINKNFYIVNNVIY